MLVIGITIGVLFGSRGGGESDLQEDITLPEPILDAGCFEREVSDDAHPLANKMPHRRAKECSTKCRTRFFGVSDRCYCLVEVPEHRLTIGNCDSLDKNFNVSPDQRMQLYFNTVFNDECSVETTETVRNFLVEEDDAPFGFDIVTNTFRASPSTLYKDECETNIYEVQTAVSEGSNSIQTTVAAVTSFAESRLRERLKSLSASVSAEYETLFF